MRKNGNLVWAEVVSVCGENYTATQFDSFSNFGRRKAWVNG